MQRRKQIRLPEYDYSQNGAYFITICTYERKNLFGNVGANSISARMIVEEFEKTMAEYPNVFSPKYVVMPNHFHAIIQIDRTDMESTPTIMQLMQSFKRRTTIEYIRLVKSSFAEPFHKHIWQRSFYDHVIRNDRDFQEIWRYIDENPLKWKLDRFYEEQGGYGIRPYNGVYEKFTENTQNVLAFSGAFGYYKLALGKKEC